MDPARSLADAQPVPFWLDDPGRPAARARARRGRGLRPAGGRRRLLRAVDRADRQGARPRPATSSCIEGEPDRLGGLRPQRRLLRGLPHPRPAATAWSAGPSELRKLQELGARNLDAIEATVARYGIDCDFERTGEIDRRHRAVPGRRPARARRGGGRVRRSRSSCSTADAMRAEVDSPDLPRRAVGPRRRRHGAPGQARLGPGAGLRRALGVRIYERTRATALAPNGGGMAVRTDYGRVFARQVALGSGRLPLAASSGCARTSCRSTTTR